MLENKQRFCRWRADGVVWSWWSDLDFWCVWMSFPEGGKICGKLRKGLKKQAPDLFSCSHEAIGSFDFSWSLVSLKFEKFSLYFSLLIFLLSNFCLINSPAFPFVKNHLNILVLFRFCSHFALLIWLSFLYWIFMVLSRSLQNHEKQNFTEKLKVRLRLMLLFVWASFLSATFNYLGNCSDLYSFESLNYSIKSRKSDERMMKCFSQ